MGTEDVIYKLGDQGPDHTKWLRSVIAKKKKKKVLFASMAHVSSTLSSFLKEIFNSQGTCKLKGVWETRKVHKYRQSKDKEISVVI